MPERAFQRLPPPGASRNRASRIKARVSGALPPLPASLALIPSADVETFPHYGGKGCAAIGVTPENVRQNIPNVIPAGFNALPATLPDYN